jgi:hypothetical protein
MSLPFKIEYAIVCDHVRREDNGKLILIGVYGPSLLVDDLSATIALSTVARVKPLHLNESDVEFRALVNDTPMVKGLVTLRAENDEPAFIVLPPVPLKLGGPGLIKFQVRTPKERWSDLIQIEVRQKEPS